MFKRKIYDKLLKWKKESLGSKALLVKGARRIGKSTIVEEFAKQKLLNWCDEVNSSDERIPELKKVTLTFKDWQNEIINSFILNPITHSRMTNGFIEGKNNFVKVIKRIGFVYKDFDLFRERILNCDKKRK